MLTQYTGASTMIGYPWLKSKLSSTYCSRQALFICWAAEVALLARPVGFVAWLAMKQLDDAILI
jgi:hypothetical protein